MPPAAAPSASSSKASSTLPLQAAMLLSGLYFLARFTGLFQRQIIVYLLPIANVDAYTAAFDLPDFLNYLVAGGALSLTFIPIFNNLWEKKREAEAWRFFSSVASIMGLVLIVLTALAMIFTPQLIALTKPGLVRRAETFDLCVAMTRIILPAQLFFYLGGLLIGVLNAFKRFGASGWTGAAYNMTAIIIAVPLYVWTKNPLAFAWGILVGAFVGNFLLPWLATQNAPRAQRPRFRFRPTFNHPIVRRFFVLALPIMFGVSLPVVDQWITGFFASNSEGDLAYLGNANRLMIAAQGVLGQAAAVAAFPFLSSLVGRKEWPDFASFLRTGLRRLLFLTLPVSVLLILWSGPIVRIIYGNGQFNDPQNLQQTTACFWLFTLGLFAWGGQGLVARGFYALGDTVTPTLIGSVLTIGFFVPLCWPFYHWWGAPGLALATTIGATAHFVGVLWALDKKLKGHHFKAPLKLQKIAGTLLRTGVATIFMGLAGFLALKLAQPIIAHDKLGDIGLMLWTGGIAGFVFVNAANRFEIPEWKWLKSKIRRR